jgi:O-antigen/teichoic acid export membrane protein
MSDSNDGFTQVLLGSGIVFLGIVLSRALGMGGHILMVRVLSPDLLGTVSLAYTVVAVLTPAVLLGVPNGVTRMISAGVDSEERLDFARSGYVLLSVTGFIGAGVMIVFNDQIAAIFNAPGVVSLLPYFAAFLVAKPAAAVTIAIVRGYKSSSRATIARDLAPKITAVLLFGLLLLLTDPLTGAIAYWVVVPFATIAAGLYFLSDLVSLKRLFTAFPRREKLYELFSFSWPLMLESGFLLLMTSFDILALGYFETMTEVGYYRSVQPLTVVLLFVLNAFTFLYLPVATEYFENDATADLCDLYKLSTKWIVLCATPLLLVFALFSDDIIRVFLSPTYLPAQTAFVILLLGAFGRVLVGPNGATIKAIDKTRINLLSSLFGAVTNIVLNIVLIPQYGLVGAATATAIGFLAYNSVELVVLYRELGIQPFSPDLLKPIAVLLPVAALVRLTVDVDFGFVQLFLTGIGFSILVLVVTVATRSVDYKEIEGLLSMVKER